MPIGIKKYDFYRKAIDGLQTKTSVGGLISLISAIIIAILISMQTYSFLQTKTSTTLNVESQMDNSIPTVLDFSLFYMPCESFDLHFENTKTKQPTDIVVDKTDLPPRAGETNQGCRVRASFSLYPGEGNFHVGLSHGGLNFGMHNHFYNQEDLASFNCSHVIHSLSFGESREIVNTLDGYEQHKDAQVNHITYFLKLIPVRSVSLYGGVREYYEYSVTEYKQLFDKPSYFSRASPGVYFKYQLTPIRMTKKQYRTGVLQYYTTLCSIVGGVITVAGIIQSLLTHTILPAKLD